MRVCGRLEQLGRAVGALSPPGGLDLVVAMPAECGMANADGRVATVVFEGARNRWSS